MPPPFVPITDDLLWNPKLTVTRGSKPQLGKEPWRICLLQITTSPGLQTIGTASSSRSLPVSETSFLISIFPSL